MNFIAGSLLLLYKGNEEKAYLSMVYLFGKHRLNEMYDPASHQFKLMSFQTECLLRAYDTKLSTHLIDQLDLNLDIYLVRWFYSLFSVDFP